MLRGGLQAMKVSAIDVVRPRCCCAPPGGEPPGCKVILPRQGRPLPQKPAPVKAMRRPTGMTRPSRG